MFHQQGGEPRTSSPTKAVENQEALKTRALVSLQKEKSFNFSLGDSCSDFFESIITLIKIFKKKQKQKTSEQYLLRKQT